MIRWMALSAIQSANFSQSAKSAQYGQTGKSKEEIPLKRGVSDQATTGRRGSVAPTDAPAAVCHP
jgi:hypothetical protein